MLFSCPPTPCCTTVQVYDEESLFNAELELLLKTRMLDHHLEQYCEHKVCRLACFTPLCAHYALPLQECDESQLPAEVTEARAKALKSNEEFEAKQEKLKAECKTFLDVFYPEGEIADGFAIFNALNEQSSEIEKKSQFNLDHLRNEFNITKDHFGMPTTLHYTLPPHHHTTTEALYAYAKSCYETSSYADAQMFLHYYTTIGGLDSEGDARWGKLAADTLVNDWPAALDTMKALQDQIDNGVPSLYATPGAQLQARAWLMHWGLFVFFYYSNEEDSLCDEGLDKLVQLWLPDMYSGEKEAGSHRYLRVIQTICPHLIRYLSVAVIVGQEKTGKRAGRESGHITMKHRNKDLARLIEVEKAYYSDPITRFVKKLLSDCDLEGAHAALHQCELVMEADFFLSRHKERFVRQAREMIFENYCRIHSVMDIGMVAKKLGQDSAEAECYIVKMIRGAHLDAKIDSEANQVLLASQGSTLYVDRFCSSTFLLCSKRPSE